MISDAKVFTGQDSPLENSLKESISNANRIDMVASFTKVTGVCEILEDLRMAVARGTKIRFLTGTYLGITEPSAIRMLMDACGESIEIRFYKGTNSFHPKAYFFYGNGRDELYIGSSNLSRSALVDGVEWNYRLIREENPAEFDRFANEFDRLFENDDLSYDVNEEVLKRYKETRVVPKIAYPPETTPNRRNDVQLEALFNLEKSRDSGMDKALVVAATGTGKTYLAAYDSVPYKKVLFVAHTEDILQHARATFSRVRPDDSAGMCFGGELDMDRDMTFATVQTLSRNLDRFSPDMFDYIVIDEFHHAAADSYRKVIDHFQPKFLLGLTATPERMDNKDVFVLCDYNVVYEIGMKEAIERRYLCSFRYYGIYDDTDYSKIAYVNGAYKEDELTRALANDKRAASVLENYRKYGSERAIGFCSSIEHAAFMSEYFNIHGVKSAVVTSKVGMDRTRAIDGLVSGSMPVVFTVDMFNEGIDVPALDMVMFLRPTQSSTIFAQQLGRGLRVYEGKRFLTVLDFIGNYRNANRIPSLLTGREGGVRTISDLSQALPDGCTADFDLEIIKLFDLMESRKEKLRSLLRNEYERVKSEIGHVPSRCELFENMDPEAWKRLRIDKECNPFKDYLGFLAKMSDLDPIRSSFRENEAGEFLRMIETTSMSRMYKVPLIRSFFRGDRIVFEPSSEDIARSFREFYSRDNNMVDFEGVKSRERCEWTDSKWVKLASDNPIRFLCKSEPGFFGKNGKLISLSRRLERFDGMETFVNEAMDALVLREMDFKRSRYYDKRSEWSTTSWSGTGYRRSSPRTVANAKS